MGWVWIVLLACAVVVLAAAEWPRVTARFGPERRRLRARERRKAEWRVVKTEDDPDEFAASVERDLAQLPTTTDRNGE